MIFNLISIFGFVIFGLLNWGLKNFKYSDKVIRIFSIFLFVFKSIYFIVQNIKGNLSIPVEISTISYFMLPIILTFKIYKLYNVASFFGIASGLGFFLFYSVAGFTVSNSLTLIDYILSVLFHGYLFTAGLQIMFKYKFENKPHLIWITMLSIISWAMAFYDFQTRGITFVYYIIKPSYLCVSSIMPINFLIILVFYAAIITLFYFFVKLFFKLNNKLHNKNKDEGKKKNNRAKNNRNNKLIFDIYIDKKTSRRYFLLVFFLPKIIDKMGKVFIYKREYASIYYKIINIKMSVLFFILKISFMIYVRLLSFN